MEYLQMKTYLWKIGKRKKCLLTGTALPNNKRHKQYIAYNQYTVLKKENDKL